MKSLLLLAAILGMAIPGFSQGSWNPPGADLGYPRTLMDTNSIDEIRSTLSQPAKIDLYHSIYDYANSEIPDEDTTISGRINRALIAKEAAFVVIMNRKWENDSILVLSPSERDSLIVKSRYLLDHMNTKVGYQEGLVFYQEWQHRSKELINYLIAYDLLKGAGIDDQTAHDSLVHFTGNLYHRSMDTYTVYFLHLNFFTYQFNNHSIMTASALGLAAVVLNDHEDTNPDYQPQNWINAGLWNLDNTLWIENGAYPRVSEPDTLAGYAEGPAYFYYAFQNAFPFIRALWNFLPDTAIPVTFNGVTRQVPNPWYDPRYYRLYDWWNKIRMPDGSEPAIHDSDIGFGSMITSLSGRPEFNLPDPGLSYDDPFIRTQYIATNVEQGAVTDSLFQPLPAAGSLCFRSSRDPEAVYMHFIAKHGIALAGAKSHHQGDASSFSLMAYGKLLAVDPGYPGAALSDAVNKATDHNLVLVNGTGPLPPLGESVNTASNTAFIANYFHTPFLDYGEVNTTYSGTDVSRMTLFIRGRYFLLNDFLESGYPFTYTFQLHGNGLYGSSPSSPEGAFYPDFEHFRGTYTRDSVSLLVQVLAEDAADTYSYVKDSIATGYPPFRYNSTMEVTKTRNNTHFLTILYPFIADTPFIQPITAIPGITAVSVSDGPFLDLMASQLDSTTVMIPAAATGFSYDVTFHARMCFLSTGSGEIRSMLLQSGDSLFSGSQPLVFCNHPMDVVFEELIPGIFEGYVSDSGQVSLFHESPLQVAKGNALVTSWDLVRKMNGIRFFGPGNFRLEPSNGIPSSLQDDPFTVSVRPNPSADGHYLLVFHAGSRSSATLQVTDLPGRILLSRQLTITEGESRVPLDLKDLPAGGYICTLTAGKIMKTLTLIKR